MVPGTDGKTERSCLLKAIFTLLVKRKNYPYYYCSASSWEVFLHCWGKLWILFLPHPTPYPTFISPGGMTKLSRSRQVSSTRLHAMPPIILPSLLWLSLSKQHLLQNPHQCLTLLPNLCSWAPAIEMHDSLTEHTDLRSTPSSLCHCLNVNYTS